MGLPMNRRLVGRAFQPAGSGDFPVARWDTGLESPVNRQAFQPTRVSLRRGKEGHRGSGTFKRGSGLAVQGVLADFAQRGIESEFNQRSKRFSQVVGRDFWRPLRALTGYVSRG